MVRETDVHYYSVKEAADELGMHQNTLRNYLCRDDCPVPLRKYQKRGYLLISQEDIRILREQRGGMMNNDAA